MTAPALTGKKRLLLLPGSLRFQLLSRSLLILAGLLLLVGIFQYVVMKQFLYQNKAASMQSQIRSLPGNLWNRDGDTPRRARPDPAPFFVSNSSVAFIPPEGELTVISQDPGTGSVPKLEAAEYRKAMEQPDSRKPDYRLAKDEQGKQQLTVLQPVRDHGRLLGVVQVSTRTDVLQQDLFRQLLIFLSLACVALVIGLAAFLPIIRRTLVPLSRIVDTVERVDSGNLDERLPAHQGQTEVDRLSVSFNRMLERLEASFETEKEAKEQMRRFAADASHELRTPLTSIHGFLEVLLRGAASDPDQLNHALRSMLQESERMNKLVRDLLFLAKLDRTPTTQMKEGSLGNMVEDMEPQLRLLAGNRRISVSSLTGKSSSFDPDKMKQVLLNLFQNAVQHTDPEHGEIAVTVAESGGGLELSVADNGQGIPQEHLTFLFDRFYRADSSRTRKYGDGAGLGLAITKSIVDLHDGSIAVESAPGAGSTFRVWIPAP